MKPATPSAARRSAPTPTVTTNVTTVPCPACGGLTVRDERPDQVTYKGETASLVQPGWYCTACGEVVLVGEDLLARQNAFAELKAKVDSILLPKEVARIRRKLGVTQRDAGAILGGGPRAFQKYESGGEWTSRPMANLLRVLDKAPELIKELPPYHVLAAKKGVRRKRSPDEVAPA